LIHQRLPEEDLAGLRVDHLAIHLAAARLDQQVPAEPVALGRREDGERRPLAGGEIGRPAGVVALLRRDRDDRSAGIAPRLRQGLVRAERRCQGGNGQVGERRTGDVHQAPVRGHVRLEAVPEDGNPVDHLPPPEVMGAVDRDVLARKLQGGHVDLEDGRVRPDEIEGDRRRGLCARPGQVSVEARDDARRAGEPIDRHDAVLPERCPERRHRGGWIRSQLRLPIADHLPGAGVKVRASLPFLALGRCREGGGGYEENDR